MNLLKIDSKFHRSGFQRAVYIVLVACLCIGWAACGDDATEQSAPGETSTSSQTGSWFTGGSSGGTSGGSQALCSLEEPQGDCPTGMTCMDGACLNLGLICQPSLPNGECPFGSRCVAGQCFEKTQICSDENDIGVCPEGEFCNQGVCTSRGECSTGNPTGECASGEQCFEGSCRPRAEICGPNNPNEGACTDDLTCLEEVCHHPEALCSEDQTGGRCPNGETCAGGQCLSLATACTPANTTGECAGDAQCVDGICRRAEDLCGASNPRGYCSDDLVCIGGTCQEQSLACSYEVPDGLCPAGQVCSAGHCQGAEVACSPDTIWGACPAGETCVCDAQLSAGRQCGSCGICSRDYFPASASADQKRAIDRTNELRNRIGLWSLAENAEINDAATQHALYLVNEGLGQAHVQANPASPFFTGAQFWERMEAAGYGGSPMSEVIAYSGDAVRAVDGLIATVYHRIPFFDPTALEMGYGGESGSSGSADVINFGSASNPCKDPILVVWPAHGATDVDISWDGRENPLPPPPPQGYPSGPVLSVHGSGSIDIDMHKILLGDAELEHTFLTAQNDPNGSLGATEIFLYPHRPLRAQTTYDVVIAGRHDGEEFFLSWSFTTR